MKTSRRPDSETLRRVPRDRDLGLNRSRKRPSMLSEFHDKHYSHRDSERESTSTSNSSGSHYRHYRHYESGASLKRDRYGPGFFKTDSGGDIRHSSTYHRSLPSQPSEDPPTLLNHSCGEEEEEETVATLPKRPCLLADVSARSHVDPPSSADSVTSGPLTLPQTSSSSPGGRDLAPTSPPQQRSSLRAYLEDIESDEGDLLADEEEEEEEEKVKEAPRSSPTSSSSFCQPSKEQLLQNMERVDRDIVATEGHIAALQKKQAELEESLRSSSPSSSSLRPSPLTPSPSPEAEDEEDMASPSCLLEGKRASPKHSLLEMIYSENRVKARICQASLSHLSSLQFNTSTSSSAPLYYQPWEAPGYFEIIERHKTLRSNLINLIQQLKSEKHKRDLALCKQYDYCMTEWRRQLDKSENSHKKKSRDQKNREMFERAFPELKMKREQQERLMRVDQRGYGVVRSDLELSQLMCELYEQEEAPARTRRTHAVIPAMVTGGPGEKLQFRSTNGLIQDPMAVHRAAKLVNVWTDEEKKLFREKYAIYPKNFEVISTYLPSKTTGECIHYYYLSKKNEKFKQMARRATFKRRKFIKPNDLTSLSSRPDLVGDKPKLRSPLLSGIIPIQQSGTRTLSREEEPKSPKPSRFGDWTDEEISSLRTGLKKWGRAWGKIYREVGGKKTATECKRFYDNFCHDPTLGLEQVLSERSSLKTAERAQRKAESRKAAPVVVPTISRKRSLKLKPPPGQELCTGEEREEEREEKPLSAPTEEGDGELLESASNIDSASGGEDSGSESTITDSSPEDGKTAPQVSRGNRSRRSTGTGRLPQESGALNLFISAAEALSHSVPPEIALHDHSYALAPINSNVELQGSSGLSLIAAAAEVVSPTLSRSAGSGKFPAVPPVRAPRGRPPNTQRRGSGNSTSKLAPTLLSPAGNSIYVPLTDTTKSFRNRTRSAPADRPKLQLPRSGPSNLRYSLATSKTATSRPLLPPSFVRSKDPSSSASSSPNSSTKGSALKSMIASRTPQAAVGNSNAAFETLVNVAVAASPAELPKSTTTLTTPPAPPTSTPAATISLSFQNSSSSTSSVDGQETTYNLDMNQAINFLTLSLAPSSSSPSQQVLLAQACSQAPGLLGTFVNQTSPHQTTGAKTTPSSANTVNVLIGHLTSGNSNFSSSTVGSFLSDGRGSSQTPNTHHLTEKTASKPSTNRTPSSTHSLISSSSSSSMSPSLPHSSSSVGDDLSNLNLLSSLVAVVANSKTPPSPSSSSSSSSSSRKHTPSTSTKHTESPVGYSMASTPFTHSSHTHSGHPPAMNIRTSSAFKATNLPSGALPTTASDSTSTYTPTDKLLVGSKLKVKDKTSPSLSTVTSNISGTAGPLVTGQKSHLVSRSIPHASPLPHQPSHTPPDNTLAASHTTPSSLSPSSFPSPTPSISQQSTLLLYTHSLSLPNTTGGDREPEEEDHLDCATRGISELSKLLGSDASADSLGSNSGAESTGSAVSFRAPWTSNSNPLPASRGHHSSLAAASSLTSSSSTQHPELNDVRSNEPCKPYLSDLLEGPTHSHTHTHLQPNNSNCNNNNNNIATDDLKWTGPL